MTPRPARTRPFTVTRTTRVAVGLGPGALRPLARGALTWGHGLPGPGSRAATARIGVPRGLLEVLPDDV
eukprot:7926150-Alexandrium_andersonii.AAC.1